MSQDMVQTTYHVFLQQDGRYGIALSRFGRIGHVATGFAAQSETQAWIEADRQLEIANSVSADGVPPVGFRFIPDRGEGAA